MDSFGSRHRGPFSGQLRLFGRPLSRAFVVALCAGCSVYDPDLVADGPGHNEDGGAIEDTDSGVADAGTADGETGTSDGGTADNGTVDGGTVDGGTADGGSTTPPPASPCEHPEEPLVGAFSKLYDSGSDYINDHTIIRGANGQWHLFGITHAEPANALDETTFAHATAPNLHGPWTKQAPAFVAEAPYETLLWAPYVIREGGTYYMFYTGGGPSTAFRMRIATSTDLNTWTRIPTPIFTDGYEARDAMVLRIGSEWVLYYTANGAAAGGNHVIAYRTSTDLVTWGARQVAFTHPDTGTFGGPTESPFVVRRGDDYYLFTGPRRGHQAGAPYSDTAVYHSQDPFHFEPSRQVYDFPAHAAEVVTDTDGTFYATHAGWGQGGVHIAPLSWKPTACRTLEGDNYVATVQTAPRGGLRSFEVAGEDLLSPLYRMTGPYLGLGGFGTHMPGEPVEVRVSQDAQRITLASIPFPGQQSVRVDWTLCANDDALDHLLTWDVVGFSVSAVYEVAFGLQTSLPNLRNNASASATGDLPGFPQWLLFSGPSASLALSYVQGSAWQDDQHWLLPERGMSSFQPLWSNFGTSWAVGRYPGGRFRLAGSNTPNDTALANAIRAASSVCEPVP